MIRRVSNAITVRVGLAGECERNEIVARVLRELLRHRASARIREHRDEAASSGAERRRGERAVHDVDGDGRGRVVERRDGDVPSLASATTPKTPWATPPAVNAVSMIGPSEVLVLATTFTRPV